MTTNSDHKRAVIATDLLSSLFKRLRLCLRHFALPKLPHSDPAGASVSPGALNRNGAGNTQDYRLWWPKNR